MTKLLCFDLFGTVIDMANVDRDELRAYGDFLAEWRRSRQWLPLELPESWATLPAFHDARDGLELLAEKGYRCVTLSNAPLPLTRAMLRHNDLTFAGIVPLEATGAYKTDPACYTFACALWGVPPCDAAMVTANRTFGDLEAAAGIGMRPILIRDSTPCPADHYPDILALAESLPCLG